MFSILISLYDGRSYIFPIFKNFQIRYIDSSGTFTPDGIKYISDKFYFLNQIQKAEVYCDNFKLLLTLFGHKQTIRNALTVYTPNSSKKLIDSSRIFNHTHISTNNYLTPEGVKLVFGTDCNEHAWILISNYQIVFDEYYKYCESYESQPPTHKSSGFGFGYSLGCGEISMPLFKNVTTPLFKNVNTPQKKHKSEEELICPGAPKKIRK